MTPTQNTHTHTHTHVLANTYTQTYKHTHTHTDRTGCGGGSTAPCPLPAIAVEPGMGYLHPRVRGMAVAFPPYHPHIPKSIRNRGRMARVSGRATLLITDPVYTTLTNNYTTILLHYNYNYTNTSKLTY